MASSRKAALGFIFITLLIDVTGLGIIIPVLPKLISKPIVWVELLVRYFTSTKTPFLFQGAAFC